MEKKITEAAEIINTDVKLIDSELDRLIPYSEEIPQLIESMRYSASGGGKRIRPVLALEFCRLFGGSDEAGLRFGSAVELVHTYSLIHDDLPEMDNDDARRGKPTNHKVYGHAVALLAGDALLTYAFEVLAANRLVTPEMTVKAVERLSSCAGAYGMAGGQALEFVSGKSADIERIDRLKTGKLFEAACLLGCYAAGVSDSAKLEAAECYAHALGRVFQITDDILDKENDERGERLSILNKMSVEEARSLAYTLTEEACAAIEPYDGSEALCSLARFLLDRKN